MARTIAFFLPQFHETKENNEWWGKGFTEWTNVKNAEPCYKGHIQPRVPLNDNYYNLLEKETMIWQTKLVNDAGMEGLCYYHYWFKGRKILEKPAENLLEWKDIPQKFCFSWANESWKRTWDKTEGNDWNEVLDKKYNDESRDRGNGVLLEQNYGTEEDWIEHFDYLLPFFKDERYITYNGRPVFIIYRPSKIECLDEMLKCWQERAKAAGINKIYIIATNESVKLSPYIDASLCYEPSYTMNHDMHFRYRIRDKVAGVIKKHNITFLRKYNYVLFLREILKREIKEEKNFPGIFVGFDDTPRRGKNGAVFKNVSSEVFGDAYSQLLRKVNDDDFVFITAWNEWAEGAYLEPDAINGTKWLDTIKKCQ